MTAHRTTDALTRRRGVALEDAILEAAFAELSEAGYAAFTVEAVATRARTGKASIYRRWNTKQELVLDALCRCLPTTEQCGIQDHFPDCVSTADALRGLATTIAGLLASPAGHAMRAIKCEAVNDPELAQAIDDRFQAPRRAALLALLARGVERGEVRPGAVTTLVADVLPAVLMHRMVLNREDVTPEWLTAVVEDILLPLIAPR